MLDNFLFIGLPYASIFLFVIGLAARFKLRAFSYSSLSTQFLENRWLAWASLPWHVGIMIIFTGHMIPLFFPGLWSSLVASPGFLAAVETLGIFGAFLCLAGLILFLIRRFVDARLQAVTSFLDVAAVLILLFQVSSGLAVALAHPWGASWAPRILGHYLHGIFSLQPDAGILRDMPPFIKIHIASAWFLFALFPFTRLAHAILVPIHYFFRRPQKVVWNNSRAQARFEKRAASDTERRLLLKASLGTGAAAALLSMGALDKFLRYFLKQELSVPEESHLLSAKLQHLKQTAEERELQLERMSRDMIFIAKLSELTRDKGKYFIDYEMRPALAFRDEQGFPIVLSAKCTHLGCTVGQNLDGQGRILCPCHISYFDIKTGQPNEGAPAKKPLPHLGWALKDESGKVLVTQSETGKREGSLTTEQMENSQLFILKPQLIYDRL